MAIIIPSKKTYEFSNAIVNQNVISYLEYQVNKHEIRSSKSSLQKEIEDVSQIATFLPILTDIPSNINDYPRLNLAEFQISTATQTDASVQPNRKYLSIAGIKPIYKEFSLFVKTQLTDNSFASTNVEENPITATIRKTVELRERELSIDLLGTFPNFTFDAYISNDYETVDTKYTGLTKPKKITDAIIPYSGSIAYDNNGTAFAKLDWSLKEIEDEYQHIIDNEVKLNVEGVKLEPLGIVGFIVKARILCGALLFEGTDLVSSNNYLTTKLFEYRPINLSLEIFGTTYELLTQEEIYTKSSANLNGERVSITNNSFIQNAEYISNKAESLIQQYSNGKETAKVRCSIGEYADENDNLVISTKTDSKMLFEHYDKVVPMVRNGDGIDLAMSYDKNGLAKVFDVVGVKVFFDGAVWQELTLRESGESIDLGRTTYTTIGNKAGGLTYKITSNQIRTEINSAGGITYIIGE